jgi:co-chaperonin GroES (HSP10)
MIRMLSDNILIRLEPQPTETASGIALVHTRKAGAKEHRTAEVIAVGPGHYPGCKSCGGAKPTFIPTTLVAGDRIVVDAVCGQPWDFDVSAVRQNERAEFDSLFGEKSEWPLALLADESKAAE